MKQKFYKSILLSFSAFVFYSCGGIWNSSINEISLNNNWQVKSVTDSIHFITDLPNEIHLDLYNNKIIEHPFFGDNEKNIQWIAEKDWVYEKNFDVDSTILSSENVEIIFDGIDTYSDVYLNEQLILQTDNQFRKWKTDVKSILKTSNNKLKILIRSPFEIENKKARKYGFQPPNDSRIFTRKAAYVYGWDWGPRIVTSGIWKPVKMESWNGPRLKDVFIIQDSLTERKAYLTTVFEISSDKQEEITLLAYDQKKKLIIMQGNQTAEIKFEIDNPELWWPNNLGNQKLYKINCSLIQNDFGVQTISKKIGLKTIELIQEKDSLGKSFYFKVNGLPVFMKGANYIPMQILGNDVDTNKYIKLINDAAESNMNMLRIWGGGIYEHDIFYDLCDEKGILVWQDFMFANGMYPADPTMLTSIKIEAEEQIKRLRNHPSLALFCGNNEIAEAWANWGWKDKYPIDQQRKMEDDYNQIFSKLLRGLVAQHSPQIPYWSSSPQFGRGDERSQFEGDSHYWGVWHDEEPFEMYEQKVPRFMSEFGFQSYPSLKTLSPWFDEKDINCNSSILQNHQKHPKGNEFIKKYMERDFIVPENFSNFIYVSQLLQAEGIARGIEAHRRAMPYCMGSLYWQLNDCWPVISWSGIDYEGRWKALQYFVKKSFAPLLVSYEKKENALNVFAINDYNYPINGELLISVADFNGNNIFSKKEVCNIESRTSKVIYKLDLIDRSSIDKTCSYIFIKLISEDQIIAEKTFYFVKPKELKLSEPQINLTIDKTNRLFVISVSSNVLAKNVYLESSVDGKFSDNFFDLIPGEQKAIEFYPDKDIDEVSFKVVSLWNTIEKKN